MSFVDFVKWLATSAALGITSTAIMQVIKAIWPRVKDKAAAIASVIVAALIAAGAIAALPYLGEVPAWVETYWPIAIWLWSQLWYQTIKPAKITSS